MFLQFIQCKLNNLLRDSDLSNYIVKLFMPRLQRRSDAEQLRLLIGLRLKIYDILKEQHVKGVDKFFKLLTRSKLYTH